MSSIDIKNTVNKLWQCGIVQNKSIAENDLKNKGSISFDVPNVNIHPASVHNVRVTLDMKIERGKDCLNNQNNNDEKQNDEKWELPSFSQYDFKLIFSGNDDNGINYISSWHLDYEPKVKYPYISTLLKVNHPLFHLHYGGSEMRSVYQNLNQKSELLNNGESGCSCFIDKLKEIINDDDVSSRIDEAVLNMSADFETFVNDAQMNNTSYIPLHMIAPRIPFPPMDEYLGLDFIISNFFEKSVYNDFRTRFDKDIRTSQKILWGPYFSIISDFWNNLSNKRISPKMIIPSLR